MTAQHIARLAVTAIAAGNGFLPIVIDLNRTHATHPLWPGHARFHLVQQVATLALAALLELALLWWPGPGLDFRFYLAAAFVAISLAGFLLAVLTRPLYRGTLHDPNGMKPVSVRWRGRTALIDVNVPIVLTAAILLAAAIWLDARPD